MRYLNNIADEVKKDVLFSQKEIEDRILELGNKITDFYKDEEEELVVVGILRGSSIFFSDLIKKINLPILIDFMAISSYGKSSNSGVVKIIKDLEEDLSGKNVLIVEDIIDTGNTLKYLLNYLTDRGAKSVKIASLLDKPSRRLVEINGDFVGFKVPDDFIVGYGLDYAQAYRNLPYIISIKQEVYKK